MSLLLFVGGGALAGALVRWWYARLGWGWIAGYWLAAGAFFAAPLLTPALQVPTDVVYESLPWREMAAAPVVPANPLLGDVPLQMIPYRQLVRTRLLRGEAPLWAHEVGTGQPLLGNAQSAPFSPFGLLTLPLPPVRQLPVMAALRLFLSLLFTHCLLLELGAGAAGALFAALAFTFSVFSICWALHPHGMAAAWLPGLALGLVLLRRGGRGALAGLTACGTGLALSGHPETMAHGALAAVVVAGGLLVGSAVAPRARFLVRLAAAAALTAGLTAPVLLPVVEALPEAIRTRQVAVRPESVQPPPFSAAGLRVLIDPLAFGSPRDADYSGPWNYNELCTGYAGALTLALAVAAALALRGRALAIFAGGAAALAAAFAIPPFLALVRALPLLGNAANGRLRLMWVLAAAVTAGLGLERLSQGRAGRFAAAACAGAAALALALDRQPHAPWQRAWWLAAVAGTGLTAAAFLHAAGRRSAAPATAAATTAGAGQAAGARRATTPEAPEAPAATGTGLTATPFLRAAALRSAAAAPEKWLPWLAVACLALDLGLLEARFLPVLPTAFDLAPPPAVTELRRARREAAGQPFRVLGSAYDLTPNLASFYGLWDPRGYDPMQPARAAWVVNTMVRPHEMLRSGREYPAAYLSFLGVRYMLTPHAQRLGPPWREAWDGRGGKLWFNPEALPLFFMPASWRPARDPDEALRSAVFIGDFAATAVAELDVEGEQGAAGRGARQAGGGQRVPPGAARELPPVAGPVRLPRRQQGGARLRSAGSNGFALDVSTPSGGLVASSVSFARGWQLTLDGQPAPLLRVNGGFLGFLAPPGEHHARLDYRPAGWVWGLRICGATVAALLAFGALPAARRRSVRAAGSQRRPPRSAP
jgi:hypothetical protein